MAKSQPHPEKNCLGAERLDPELAASAAFSSNFGVAKLELISPFFDPMFKT
jgi:hypothetical protein